MALNSGAIHNETLLKLCNDIINNLGFTHVINDFNIGTNYLPLFKRRIRDQFIQEWNTGINNCPKLDYYSKFKKTFCYEEY